jgi:hypothetical protein
MFYAVTVKEKVVSIEYASDSWSTALVACAPNGFVIEADDDAEAYSIASDYHNHLCTQCNAVVDHGHTRVIGHGHSRRVDCEFNHDHATALCTLCKSEERALKL